MNTQKIKKLDVVGATAVLVVGASAFGVAIASASAVDIPADASIYLTAYDSAQSVSDQLPDGFPAELHGEGGLLPETARFLGEVGKDSSYWVVRDASGNVCLVLNDQERGMTGAGCGNVADLKDGTIAVSVAEGDFGGFQAFLVADGFVPDVVEAPWVRGGPNLLVVPLEAADGSALRLSDESHDVEVRQFPDAVSR